MLLKEKYINPFTDFGFKKLFGTEPNKDLLIDFLNEVILPEQRKITDLTHEKNDSISQTELDHKAIFKICYDKLPFTYVKTLSFTKTESELETPKDKWLYIFKYLPKLEECPEKLREKKFKRIFEAALLSKCNTEELKEYEYNFRYYRDLKNVLDTAYQDGKAKGIREGKR